MLTKLDPQELRDSAHAIPYQKIKSGLFPGIALWMRRDDLLDPIISGNKAFKLVFNLAQARLFGAHTLITCGGAWSNHIHATAAAGMRLGFKTVGIIRGERAPTPSATLVDAERFGMQLIHLSRTAYRQRHNPDFLPQLGITDPFALFIPEGGANIAGARGVQLLASAIQHTQPVHFDEIWLACGTGLTLGALQSGLKNQKVVGVPVLKAAKSIAREAALWQKQLIGKMINMELKPEYHCGGYARRPAYLKAFQNQFEQQTGILLDPVYTLKLAYALHRECLLKRLTPGANVLLLHTGGLQGRRSTCHTDRVQ